MIQANATMELVQMELQKLLHDQSYLSSIKTEYENLYHVLDTGSASENTARLITEHLARK
jgi:lipid A disaccharide synthetase